MHSHKLIALIGVVTIAIAGCASEETTVTSSPAPSPSTASPQPSAASTQPTAAKPLVAQRTQTSNPVPGLIQPTNIKERERQIQSEIKNRNEEDPFAGLSPVVPKTPANALKPVPQVSQLPNTSGGSSAQPGTSRPTAQGDGGGSSTQPKREIASPCNPQASDGALGANIPSASSTAALPGRPSTDTASSIEVTGVVTVGNRTRAIVVAPGDPGSRYVSVGERISNGKVLVKRIEMNTGSEPVVVLEENGVEVAKSVGEKAPSKQATS